jgi:cytochrome b561
MTEPTTAIAHDRYDRITIWFHWLTAVLVITLFGTAFAWNNAPRDWGLRYLEGVHVSLGIALAAVLIGRLVWRLIAGRKLATVGNALTAPLSRIVHGVIYVLLAAQVGLGFGLRWFQGEDFSFFGLFSIPSLFTPDRAVSHQIENLHNLAGWTLIYVAGAHAAAALFHRYVLKDGVLKRMLPIAG